MDENRLEGTARNLGGKVQEDRIGLQVLVSAVQNV